MSVPGAYTDLSRVQLDDCWNRIGVRGDRTCARLTTYLHCRNCPVHAAAAVALLDAPMTEDHLQRWTAHIAAAQPQPDHDSLSLVLFRVGGELFALPTRVFDEIADLRPIHSLPQRRGGLILGVCNVRGELRVCVSLHRMLGVAPAPPAARSRHLQEARLLVLLFHGSRAVLPVDAVLGIERVPQRALQPLPATLSKATAAYSRTLFQWQQHAVGLLDESLLFRTIDRSLPSSSMT
jgi:chemotaxis-related protein WspD